MNSQLLVLASTSIYRSQLLATLGLPFQTASPEVDETPLPHEDAAQTAYRLSQTKAQAVSDRFPNSLIIGSDQVVLLEGEQLGKPLTHDNAVRQLRMMRGKTVEFHTALSLLNSATGEIQSEVVTTLVSFRNLRDSAIEAYLCKEQPYQCAGSAKSEGLGIALISRIQGDDPNALIGLPLIALVGMLEKQGISPLSP